MSETSDTRDRVERDPISMKQRMHEANVATVRLHILDFTNEEFLDLLANELRRRSDPSIEPPYHADGNVYVIAAEGQHFDITLSDHDEV